MCRTGSVVLTKKFKVLAHPESDRHEDIIKKYQVEHKLKDDSYGEHRDFMRIEITPNQTLTSINPGDWKYRLDENKPLPQWYCPEYAEKVAKEEFLKLIKNGRYVNDWKGDLDLRGTGITALPKSLKVQGKIYR